MSTLSCLLCKVAGLAVFLALLSLTVTQAQAHNPIMAGGNHNLSTAVRIPDPAVSYALYGYLDTPGEAQFYYVDISSPVRLMTQLNIPKNDAHASFRPSYALVGPGIRESDPVPFDVPGGNGSLLVSASLQEPVSAFYEPFSGITYNTSVKTYTNLTVPGRYYIAIFDESHKRGDYVLATGEQEAFSIWDMPSVTWKVLGLRLGWYDHSKEILAGT